MRLIQIIKHYYNVTKSEAFKIFQENNVMVDFVRRKPSYNVLENEKVYINDKLIELPADFGQTYILFNKPIGIECTNNINKDNNIREYLKTDKLLSCVGRLDKGSCGLIILTDDSKFINMVNNPINHVDKTYFVRFLKPIDELLINTFKNGEVVIKNKITKEAKIEVIDQYHAYVTLSQGLYHQVRLTAKYAYNKVIYLERVKIGNISNIDHHLAFGESRKLSFDEVLKLIKK